MSLNRTILSEKRFYELDENEHKHDKNSTKLTSSLKYRKRGKKKITYITHQYTYTSPIKLEPTLSIREN